MQKGFRAVCGNQIPELDFHGSEVSIRDFAETDVHAVGVNDRWKSDFGLRFS